MRKEVEVNRRLASMRAGLISVAMLVAVCFALAFFLSGSQLEANIGDEAETAAQMNEQQRSEDGNAISEE